ncbi:uncharacterized protein LOC126896579 [Daktulosphaira vitifoliae]|uniref:uncharacterized protein LOC126896579 n=1 Tax=Daktulosphaira vitifoliae TaxID=58002 RepID=UPI0021AA848D|nr:uncharacterized protein LOC126896579 [Daktulosphaira vitifoliae]
MSSLNLYFVLFSVILYTKARWMTQESLYKLDKLLQYSGWKYLNEIRSVKYKSKTYILKNLIEIPIDGHNCNAKTRGLTLYLGCTYAKVINNLFSSIISNMLRVCKRKITENDLPNGFICTEELVNIIYTLIVPITILMDGAIHTLDLLHLKPLATVFNKCFRTNRLYNTIEKILDELKEQTLSRDDISTYKCTLKTVDLFSRIIVPSIYNEMLPHCDFVPYDKNYVWDKWVDKYKSIIDKDLNSSFFKFLKKKVKDYIETVVMKKYFQLGFKFDPFTEETYIQLPKEPIELELEFKTTDEERSILIQIETH